MKLISAVPLDEGQRARLIEIEPKLEIVCDGFRWAARELAEIIEPDAAVLYATRVPPDLLDRTPRLEWLQLISAGCNHVPASVADNPAIAITTCSGIHATPIAEYVLGAMLSLYRWLPQAMRGQLKREWGSQFEYSRGSGELRGKTVGILGYGSIGREVARLAQPFGTRILALKRDPTRRADDGYRPEGVGDPEGTIPERFFGPDELNAMLAESDVVVVTVPLVPATRHLLGPDQFAAMKPKSYVINIARGEVIDQAAVTEALKNGTIAGAALDVFEKEPLPQESELWELENLLITPHVAGGSRPYQRRAFEVLAENFGRHVKGERLLNRVDPSLGY